MRLKKLAVPPVTAAIYNNGETYYNEGDVPLFRTPNPFGSGIGPEEPALNPDAICVEAEGANVRKTRWPDCTEWLLTLSDRKIQQLRRDAWCSCPTADLFVDWMAGTKRDKKAERIIDSCDVYSTYLDGPAAERWYKKTSSMSIELSAKAKEEKTKRDKDRYAKHREEVARRLSTIIIIKRSGITRGEWMP